MDAQFANPLPRRRPAAGQARAALIKKKSQRAS